MASTFTTNLNLEKQAAGENTDTWGSKLNDVLDNLDDAIAGRLNKSVAGSADVTLTTAEARNAWHEYNGALTGNINVIVPTKNKLYHVFNNTSGAFTLTVKTSAGTGIAVTQGEKEILVCDGTNVIQGTDFLVDPLTTRGDLMVRDASAATRLAVGVANTVLKSDGTDPAWANVNGAMIRFGSDAQGDVAYFNGTDWARLGAGTSGQFLKTQGAGANPVWASAGIGVADFTSAEQDVNADTVLEIAHSLGGLPDLIEVVLRNKTSEHGYSVSDEVIFSSQSASSDQGVSISKDGTNITIIQSSAIRVVSQSTVNTVSITAGSWKWVVKAWKT